MIFVTRDKSERPLFYAYVNDVREKSYPNGGKSTVYTLGTSEKKKDDTKVYSSWFVTLMGNARKACEERPLEKGDNIAVYGFKQTNVSKKNDDGTYGKAYLNLMISDYELQERQNQQPQQYENAPEDNYAY